MAPEARAPGHRSDAAGQGLQLSRGTPGPAPRLRGQMGERSPSAVRPRLEGQRGARRRQSVLPAATVTKPFPSFSPRGSPERPKLPLPGGHRGPWTPVLAGPANPLLQHWAWVQTGLPRPRWSPGSPSAGGAARGRRCSTPPLPGPVRPSARLSTVCFTAPISDRGAALCRQASEGPHATNTLHKNDLLIRARSHRTG